MPTQSLLEKLQHIVSQSKHINNPNSHTGDQYHNINQQIKGQLSKYYDFTYQQIIKLSAYYQAKLQYQAIDYEEEISCLKQEIQRQYKVIGLMKLELQDLVFLVNQRRNHEVCSNCKYRVEGVRVEDRMKNQEEYKEWRVKKSDEAKIYTQKPQSWKNNNCEGNKVKHQMQNNQSNEPHEHPQSYSRSASTISGLEIITEQQTQRTLMSAGDEEDYPIQPDYLEEEYDVDETNKIKHQEFNDQNTQKIKCEQQENQKMPQMPQNQIINLPENHILIQEPENHPQQFEIEKQNNLSFTPTTNQIHENHLSQQPEGQKQQLSHEEETFSVHIQPVHFNHQSEPSRNPQFTFVQKHQKSSQKSNFVQNPFAKKLSQNNQSFSIQQQSHQNPSNQQQEQQSTEQFMLEARKFLKNYRPEFKQPTKQPVSQKPKSSSSSVMSILQIIATSNFEPHSKRSSQRSNKLASSRSKSKGNKESKKSIQNKSSAKQKKRSSKKAIYYNHQTEQQPEIDDENNSRFTMVRCPTTEDITSTQRHNPKSFDQTQRYTSNDFRDQHEDFDTCDKDLRSFHTTFGRPSSSQFLKDPSSVNNKDINLENFFTNQRKGSIKWKKQPLSLKQNFGNKQNERQRRMSQKAPSSKPSNIISKKPSTKYLKPNASFASQQSIHSMLQSHLQNSNKFLVGGKKQQVKYDGERMALGPQQIRHGHGTLYYSNGLIYEGEFSNNRRQGFGLLKFNHVELYSGQWQNDELCGKGKIRNCAIINKKKKQLTQGLGINSQNTQHSNMFSKWISYTGQFMSNRFEGEGTLYLQGGQKFAGWFRNGVADGQGCLYRKNGQVENGVWRNNVLVERYEN